MLKLLENEYKRKCSYRWSTLQYYSGAFLVSILYFCILKIFSLDSLFWNCSYFIVIVLYVGVYTLNFFGIRKIDKEIKQTIIEYSLLLKKERLLNLVSLLQQNGFKTKEDIQLAIDYYENEKGISGKFFLWKGFATVMSLIISILGIVYVGDTRNPEMMANAIEIFLYVFFTTFLLFFVIWICFKIIEDLYRGLFFLDITEDLIEISIHFDEYKEKLCEK